MHQREKNVYPCKRAVILNLLSVFSSHRLNESGRLIMRPYYGIVFMLGETNCYSCGEGCMNKKENVYVICAPQHCHQELQ